MECFTTALGGLITICLAYALALAFNVVKYHSYSIKPGAVRMPPGSLGLPLLGETLEFLNCFNGGKPDLFWNKRNGSKSYKGLFRTHLFGQPTICVTTPKLAKSVLMNDNHFGIGWPKSALKLVGGKSFLTVSGEAHKRLRRLTAGSITSTNSLNRVLSHVLTLTTQTFSCWAEKREVAVLPEILKLTFNIIAKMVLSYEPSGKEAEAFGSELNHLNLGLRTIAIDLPGTPYSRALKARRKLTVRLQSIIDARRASTGNSDATYSDILDSLLRSKDKKGQGLGDEEIIDTVLAFLMAGHETSAHSIVWIMYFLQKHPHALHKLKEEQQRIHEQKGGTKSLSVSDFKGMPCMARVIDETLRIVNLSPFTFRRALKDVELNDSTIPKGWSVQVWFRAIHLDPTIFPDPHTFNPDRWIDNKPRLGAYVPFGAGARGCPGSDLAKLQISAIVHLLVLSYRWEPVNPDSKITYLPRPKPAYGYPVKFFRNNTV